jgi:hypothetical protein
MENNLTRMKKLPIMANNSSPCPEEEGGGCQIPGAEKHNIKNFYC